MFPVIFCTRLGMLANLMCCRHRWEPDVKEWVKTPEQKRKEEDEKKKKEEEEKKKAEEGEKKD